MHGLGHRPTRRRAAPHDRRVRPTPDEFLPSLREVGGYRVVRTLSASRHSIRMIVHAAGRSWVARIFARDCPDELVDREVDVSDAVRAASGTLPHHVSLVHDLSTTADGRIALIDEHVAGARLDALLRARRSTLALGEAVTILAPLAGAVDEAHRIGLTGLLLDASAVRFRTSGAPVITRRATARVGPALPDRFREREPRYALDREALERVVEAVADAVSVDDQPALLAVLRRRGANLEHALFDLAAPLPVRFEVEGDAAVEDSPVVRSPVTGLARTAPTDLEVGVPDDTPPGPLPRLRAAVVASLESLGLPASVIETVRGAVDAAAGRVARLVSLVHRSTGSSSRAVRPKVVLAGVAGAAAFAIAIALASGSGGEAETVIDGDPSRVGDTVQPVAAPSEAGASAPAITETELHPEPETWPALVEVLIDRWIDCAPVTTASEHPDDRVGDATSAVVGLGCAAAVVHEGSAAAALITTDDARHQLLREWSRAGGETVVVERMGAAVLVDLVVDNTATASLLVVRSEAGWRIRDVIG